MAPWDTPRPTTPVGGLLAFAALQTAAVSLLAGVAAALLRFSPLGLQLYDLAPGPSGPAAVATMAVVRVALAAVAALPVLATVAVGWYLVTRVEARGPGETDSLGSPLALLGVAVAGLLVAGATLGTGALADPTAGLVEETVADPTTAWRYEHEAVGDGRGLLTVTFDRGQSVWAAHLSVRGTGFADVPGADRTEPGPWTGAATGGVLHPGDATTVGVTGDCEIRLVYRFGDRVETVGRYECGGRRDAAATGPPERRGGP